MVFGKSACGSRPPEKMTYPLFSSATFYMSGAVCMVSTLECGCFAKLEWSLGEAANYRRYMECHVFMANEVIGSNIVAKPGHGLITLQPNMCEGGKWR